MSTRGLSEATALVASAPGKAMLIGEYAVLEGAPSVVTAVDVRAYAFVAREGVDVPRDVSPFVQAALDEGPTQTAQATIPIVETVGFVAGHRKIGLGSSAAVTAAVIAYQSLQAGQGLDEASHAGVLAAASAAHRKAQSGKGSGADVAASVLGGTLVYQDQTATALAWPSWLHVAFFDAGAPASTTAFLARVEAGAQARPASHREAMRHLGDAATEFIAAFQAPQAAFAALRRSVAIHVSGLRQLAANANAAILTSSIDTIIDAAQELGLAAKPSGAGGGDLVVVFADQPAKLDQLEYRLRRQHGIARASQLRVHAQGVRQEARAPVCSRAPGFFRLSADDRRRRVAQAVGLGGEDYTAIEADGLGSIAAEHLAENVLGTFELPFGVATNFRINGGDLLVPMVTEEASVIAAASNAAKLIRAGGGFIAHGDPPWMIAQVQLVDEAEVGVGQLSARLDDAKAKLLALADAQHPRLVARGGGAREIEVRILDARNVVVHVLVDCRDAMGANLLNTVAEALAPRLGEITGWSPRLRILSNLADRRCVHVSARVPVALLSRDEIDGLVVAQSVVDACEFAELDPYRAATHNKGIMNGVDAVVMASANDWRAVEAAAHAFAASKGRYRPLSRWRLESVEGESFLSGELHMPMALGIVGGATRAHPAARLALRMLESPSAAALGCIAGAAGLASNLAALRALATEGIQRGHMSLHARAVALSAGAEGPELEILAKQLIDVGEIKRERALALLTEIRKPT